MKNVIVNFNKKGAENLRSVIGAGNELDEFSTVTELNRAMQRGTSYDKALLWHTYPVDGQDDSRIMSEYAEELEVLASILSRSNDAPEVWIMEKTREGCAFDFERLGNLTDLVIVHVPNGAAMGPVLQAALGSTIATIKTQRNLVGLYDAVCYNEDAEEAAAQFDDVDEFEDEGFEDASGDGFTDSDDFADGDDSGFVDGDDPDFTDGDDSDFEDGDDSGFEDAGDEFSTEDDDVIQFSDDETDDDGAEDMSAPAPQTYEESDEFGDADEFEDASDDDFEDASDDTSFDEGDDFTDESGDDGLIGFADDTDDTDDFVPKTQTTPVYEEEDEFEPAPAPAEALADVDEFEESVEEPVAEETFEDATETSFAEEDEFTPGAPAPAASPEPIPATVYAEEPKKKKGFGGLFGKKDKTPEPVPVPVPTAQPAGNSVVQAGDAELVNSVENAQLSKSALNVLKSVCAKRCCQITVTGERGSGKSTVAMNIGNVLSKHFRVLVVDMDGETRGLSYMQNDIIQNVLPDDSSMRSLFTAGLNSGNKPFTVRKNLAITTLGLASDTFVTNDVLTVNNVVRAHNQLMKSFDFIIYDMPLNAALDKLTSFITTSYVLYCTEASNYGFMNLLFRIGNLEDSAVAQQLVENAIVVPTKSSGYSFIGNIAVRDTKQALRALQNISNELVGGECELDFADMEIAASLSYNPEVARCVGSKHFYSDTRSGFKEYSKLIASVFGL